MTKEQETEMDNTVRTEDQVRGEKQLDFYIQTIETLRKERDDYYDLLQRKQAEFENFRKRVAKEKTEIWTSAQADVLAKLLPVIDSCEKGFAAIRREREGTRLAPYREGYELLLKNLLNLLHEFGVVEIPAVGTVFDPNIHEAMVREFSDQCQEGEILEEYRKGYQIGGRLLRPAQVKVAAKPEAET
ncbi:MAG: nucleotide exchange factor GrpE [Acidobacteriota bacterium]